MRMTPFAVSDNDIPKDLFEQFKQIRSFIEWLPDFEGELLTCHALCGALAQLHPTLQRIDGYFGGFFSHSWLIDYRYPKVIMDMYPVGGGVPYIVYADSSLLPWKKLYTVKKASYDQEACRRQIEKILEHAREQGVRSM